MERVTFLLEETGERVSALLNPETVALARRSGLRTLANRPGTITGAPTSDDPRRQRMRPRRSDRSRPRPRRLPDNNAPS